jgi:regulator of sigma E protease
MDWLSGALFQLFSFVLVLGVVVLVHEYGHFLAARLVGVRVEVFSIGFGNKIFGWRRGETEYRVSWIPLGGYVRMAGEGSLEGPPTGAPDEFESRRAWEKLFILAAGPAANVLLAIALYSLSYWIGFAVPAWFQEPPRVAAVEEGSPAEQAGLLEGDEIVALNGQPQATWRGFEQAVLMRPNEEVRLRVRRDGAERELPVTIGATEKHRVGWLGIEPWCRVEVAELTAGGPAEAAGLRAGDVIERLDGERLCNNGALVAALTEGGGQERRFSLERAGGESVEIAFAPAWNEQAQTWRIGVALTQVPFVLEKRGAVAAFRAGLASTGEASLLILDTLKRLATAQMSFRAMSGPVEIADVASTAVQVGPLAVLRLLAVISINLGLLNLLPIPVLDGGRIAVVGFEAIRGRELGEDAKEWILRVGLAMIVTLMVVVLFFDVLKKFEG